MSEQVAFTLRGRNPDVLTCCHLSALSATDFRRNGAT